MSPAAGSFIIATVLGAICQLSAIIIEDQSTAAIWLTINAGDHNIELSWANASYFWEDNILITSKEPQMFTTITRSGHTAWVPQRGVIIDSYATDDVNLYTTTRFHFTYDLSRNATVSTGCYKYWASLINRMGKILASACISAYPLWMRSLQPIIGDLRIRDIFIPGTHNSGSYFAETSPYSFLKAVNKTDWTQDDDIRGQLMHGVRYLDLSVGFHNIKPKKFVIQRGLEEQRPLKRVLEQIKNFVLETNEIVIVDLHRLPTGSAFNPAVQKRLAHLLEMKLKGLLVQPPLTWDSTLNDMWAHNQFVILTCNDKDLLEKFPNLFFGSIEQRWGDSTNWSQLKSHLQQIKTLSRGRVQKEPVADMAVLQPSERDMKSPKYGGFRKITDSINKLISNLYHKELGAYANIVAVDFIRGTTLMDSVIKYNKLRSRIHCKNCISAQYSDVQTQFNHNRLL